MRRTLMSLAACGVLAVAGCSDSDNDTDTASDDDSGSGSETGGGTVEEFCTEFNALDEQFSDPEAAEDDDAVLDALRSLDPPDEIRDDFQLIVEATEAFSKVDPEDTDALADVQTEFEDRGAVEASGNVETFITDNCDTGTDDTSTDDTSTDDTSTDDTSTDGTSTDEG
jgi:clumping factor A